MTADHRRTLVDLLRKCKDDPGRFNSVFLRRPPYWWRQEELCRSIVRYKTTVAVSGNATGKDYWIGGVIPWWQFTRPGSLAFVTGPTHNVLSTVTWKEVRRAAGTWKDPRTGLPLPKLQWGARITQGTNASPLTVDLNAHIPGWQALGFSTTTIERASGQHHADLLVVVEEASDAGDDIKEAIYGLDPAKLILIGNPLKDSGWFYELARRGVEERDDPNIPDHMKVNTVVIPSTDSPDIHLDRSPRGLANRGFLEENRRTYGEDSLWWRSHVLAQFPEGATAQLIPAAWLDLCERAGKAAAGKLPKAGRMRIAVDLGGGNGGSRTVVTTRDDAALHALDVSSSWTLEQAAAVVSKRRGEFGVDDRDISYDRGGLGHDFGNRLAAVGIRGAKPYLGGEAGGRRFHKKRSAAGWACRQRLDPKHCGPDGKPRPIFAIRPDHMALLREELQALRYELKPNSKTALVEKDVTEAELGRSPDVADSFTQSFAYP